MFRYLFSQVLRILNILTGITVAVDITASSHCCGIYQMRGVSYTGPPNAEGLASLIKKTDYVGRSSRIIQFSDTGSGGEAWRRAIIKAGYQCDKFDLGLNPKTNNRLFLYHWYTHNAGEAKARKLSMTREYDYEEKQKERTIADDKSGGIARAGTYRDPLGRFLRRVR